MKTPTLEYVKTVALLVMAGSLLIMAVKKQPEEQSQASQQREEYAVVEVVQKVSTPYDSMGSGSSGFLIRDGNQYYYLPYDSGSMFDIMPKSRVPKYLRRIEFDSFISYTPLE